MKVVLLGLMVTAVAGGLIGGGLFAYFSDTETSTGNTFTAGTIDIAVDGQNPWHPEPWTMEVKPCETEYMEFTIRNVGTNPVDVWKHLKIEEVHGGIDSYYCGDSLYYVTPTPGMTPTPQPVYVSSEPECEAEGSVWDPVTQSWDAEGWEPLDDIDQYTIYDIHAGQCHIDEEEWYYVSDVESHWMYLGPLGPGESMPVWQSYHLYEWGEESNWWQGDTIYFDIELYAQQTTGNVPPPEPQWDSYNCPAKYPQ